MKKSIILYIGAAVSFALAFAWAAFVMLNGRSPILWSNKILPLPEFLTPMSGFVFVFIFIFFIKKANKSYNLEHGQSADATIQLKRAFTIANVIGVSLCVLLGLVVLVRYIVGANRFL